MLKIGDFSKLSRCSVRMLRHYDEIGLLEPAEIDRFTGYRYYSEAQLTVIGQIISLRGMGFSLAAIGEMLKLDDPERLDSFYAIRQAELRALASDTEEKLRLLDTARKRLRKEGNMDHSVSIRTLPERYAACVRMTIPRYEAEGMVWGVLCEETARMNLIPADPCLCSVTFHDGEFKERDVDVEAQKTVRGQYPDTEHVQFKLLPPVTFASTVYQGPYEKIGEANAAVAAWVRDNGYTYDGPAFNIYHISPHETKDPEQFVTEVCYPVKKADA